MSSLNGHANNGHANNSHAQARILVIDDESMVVNAVTHILNKAGYSQVEGLTDPCAAEERFRQMAPDLVLLDLRMPGMNGLQVLEKLVGSTPPSTYLPVVMLTGDDRPEVREEALSLGARDFLAKPFDRTEVLLRIRNMLDTRALHLQLQSRNQELEAKVAERTWELAETQLEVLQRLASAAEYRDDTTGFHTQRVAGMAHKLSAMCGLSAGETELIGRAAGLHDVGKIGVPDVILLKPGQLTDAEFTVMKRHTIIGATMLCGGHSKLVRTAETIARSHHEKWDGTGYPDRLAGEAIPLPARIVAVADFFDAMTHPRPYRAARPLQTTLAEVANLRGSHFDPSMVDTFFRIDNHAALI